MSRSRRFLRFSSMIFPFPYPTTAKAFLLDLDGLDIDLDSLGIGLSGSVPIGLSVTQSRAVDLTAGVDLNFSFGLDGEGQFFVLNPQLEAYFSLGEEQIEITDVIEGTFGESGTAAFVVTGDKTIGADAVASGRGEFHAGDRFNVVASRAKDAPYTVASVAYDVVSDTTTIYVLEDIESTEIAGSVAKTFDFSINLGPLGVKSEGAVVSMDASASMGVDAKLSMSDFALNGRADTLLAAASPSLGADTSFVILLPIQWAGALDGINDGSGLICEQRVSE